MKNQSRRVFTLFAFRWIALCCGVMFMIQGCSYLRFPQSIVSRPQDWTMYGGSPARTNNAHAIVEPPLSVAWEYDASSGFSPYAAASSDSVLFVGNLQGEVHAINIRTGRGFGSHDFGSAIVGTPLIDNEILYVALAHDDESIVAYNLVYGSTPWRAHLGDIESSPLLLANRIYVTTLSGKLVCLDKKTGDALWTYELPQHLRTRMIRSSPASDGSIVVFGTDNGQVRGVSINEGKLLWTAQTRGSVPASPSMSGGRVFVGSLDSSMYAFDAQSGKLLWMQPMGARIVSSQAVDELSVYVGTVGRALYCLDAKSGTILWKAATSGAITSAPLISGETIYVGCIDRMLYALDARTGKLLWQYKTDGRIKTMPVISDGMLFVLSEDRTVLAFKHSAHR